MSEKSTKERARIVETEPEKETCWCNLPVPIRIPGRPELTRFPTILTWHHCDRDVAKPQIKSVSYFPLYFTLRPLPEEPGYQMEYQSIYDPDAWIRFTARRLPLEWTAEKFVQGEFAGLTDGLGQNLFFTHLAFMSIPDNEKCMVRELAAEEIKAMTGASGARTLHTDHFLTAACLELIREAAHQHGISRTEAANLIIALISGELLAAPGAGIPR